MRSSKHLRALLRLSVALLAAAGCAASNVPAVPAAMAAVPIDSALAILTFDSAWSRVAHTHYDTLFNGVDWNAVRTELRPRAQRVQTLQELRGVLGEMLSRLNESHYGIIPGEVAGAIGGTTGPASNGDAGMDLRLVEGELTVWRVVAGGPAAEAGIRTGWRLLDVNGRAVRERVARVETLPEASRRRPLTSLLYQANAELDGAAGSTVNVKLRTHEDREIDVALVRRQTPGQVVSFGNLPPVFAAVEHQRVAMSGGCTGVISINVWVVPLSAQIDRAVDQLRDCQGMVIDLRGNPGGVSGMVMGTAGHFLNDTIPLGYMRMRTNELRFKANPRRVRPDGSTVVPFSGPLAILTDEMTASTSEFFTAALQSIGRARVFGSTSAGQALPALMLRLPSGDVLMHVIADFTGPRGVRIEGDGVVPDVRIVSTRQDLLAGRDAPLAAALDWIAGNRAGSPDATSSRQHQGRIP